MPESRARAARAEKLGRVPGQAEGGGEPGRADAADRQPVALGLVPHAVVLALGRRPQARHRSPSPACRPGPAPSRRRGRSAVPASPRSTVARSRSVLLLGRRAHQQVAEHRPGQHHALGALARAPAGSWSAAVGPPACRTRRTGPCAAGSPSRRRPAGAARRHRRTGRHSSPPSGPTISPAVVRSVHWPSIEIPAQHLRVEADLRTVLHGLAQIGQRRRPGVDDMLAGHQQPAQGESRQMRLARQQLRRGRGAGRRSRHLSRAWASIALQPRQIGLAPGDDDGTGLQQRQVQPLANRPDIPA